MISTMKPENIAIRLREVKIILAVFYFVGVIGIIVPVTSSFFLDLIPYALLFSFILLAIFHDPIVDSKTLIVFSGIYLLSFFVEVIGVNSGFIFGEYRYGNNLGIKLLNTPLIIGINWLILVYITASVTWKLKIPGVLKIITASAIMLVYDIILEQLAPVLDMWHWENFRVPLQNYLAWFILALIFHSAIKFLGIQIRNKLALIMLICQSGFFLSLYMIYKIVN